LTGSREVPHRWHLYWVDLGSRGRARPGKVRPCLAIQPDWSEHDFTFTVILPLTTRLTSAGAFPFRIRLAEGTCGLRAASEIMVDQITAWDNRAFRGDLGEVPDEVKDVVRLALLDFLDLGEAA
jgi:mRNA interferase MazF